MCANDITSIGVAYRKSVGLDNSKRWLHYFKRKDTKEFIDAVMRSEQVAEVIVEKRKSKGEGKGFNYWVHPLIAVDYAMWINPNFKVIALKWLTDNLTVFRDNSGDSYNKMCKILFETQQYAPSRGAMVITDLARAIKRDLECDDWNAASPSVLKLRDDIHTQMSMALKMGVDPVRAYKTICKELGIVNEF
jgi:hypothetical protein